jgi:hypothetical protein
MWKQEAVAQSRVLSRIETEENQKNPQIWQPISRADIWTRILPNIKQESQPLDSNVRIMIFKSKHTPGSETDHSHELLDT